jgi:AraC-like DNA-binding protein
MSRLLSTADVDARHRVAYWNDLVCDVYVQLECDAAAGAAVIDGEIASERLATLELSRVTSTAQRVRRTPAKIARASEDYFLVSIQTEGQGVVAQDGREALLRPGDFALYDSTRPYELRFDGAFQQFVLMMPGPTLRSALRDTASLTATRVGGDRGAGHLMIGMIRTLAADIATLAPESAVAVADSVTQILVAGLAALPAARREPVSRLTAYRRECMRALVRERWRDPGFGVAAIAAALRLSPSTLHRTWAAEASSLADWIWAQRLDGARRDLCDPALAARSVSEIAFACGFNDAAHFSRAFRARFGCSASELRAAQSTAWPRTTEVPPQPGGSRGGAPDHG